MNAVAILRTQLDGMQHPYDCEMSEPPTGSPCSCGLEEAKAALASLSLVEQKYRELEDENERLRDAFKRHEDGCWTFIETHDGRWVRVAEAFALQALDEATAHR